MHLPSYWRSSLSPGGPRAVDAAGGGWHGLSGPLAGPAGFGESGIPPAAVGPDLCGGPLRRVAASVGDWLVLLGERILFTKAPGIFVPKRAENFGTYGRKPLRFLTEETFSFDLMLAGGGLIFLLLYMLL